MATITPTFATVKGIDGGPDALIVTWAGLAAAGDVGAPVARPDLGDRSIQFQGTFTGAPTAVFEGSNDGVNYQTLTTPAGTAISQTAAALSQVTEAVAFARPRLSAGSGGASITATLIMRRTLR